MGYSITVKLFAALNIFAGLGIDFDPVTDIDKERNSDYCTSFQGGRLITARSSITFNARFSIDNFQLNIRRQVNAKNIAFKGEYSLMLIA